MTMTAIDLIRAGSIDPFDQNAAILELDERLKRVEAASGIDRPTEAFQQSRPHCFRQSWEGDRQGCAICGLSFSHPVHDLPRMAKRPTQEETVP
jgi:hypothetical protein